ncbi:MAG TPA: HAMP domain-containing sensor histidine kinase, partial [Chitinophagaceae bacterium]|nr:HAMP domain-containing sensor histidine kinase [Chitinophagaceae bacterium]
VLKRLDSINSALLPNKRIVLYDQHDQPVYQNQTGVMPAFHADKEFFSTIRRVGDRYSPSREMDVYARYYPAAKHGLVLVYTAFDEDGWRRLSQLKKMLLVSLLVGVVITFWVGFIFSAQLVKPINRIISEVNEISSLNLSHRIYESDGQDELSRLANTFNDLLNRLQESFNIQRRFISNASHELSTPLTSMSSQLQVTLQKERNAEEYQKVLHSIQEDVEQMSRLTKSLLEIAKTGYEGGIELNEVRIDEIMFKVVSDVKKLNAAYQVELEFGEFPDDEKSCLAYGNADLLYSALKNITENGCKYSPDKRSSVYLHFQNRQVLVEIKNRGDVIAEEEIENIFHPFYRAATAGETKGFGLGLALSKRIIRLHKGNIEVKSDVQTGTVFIIQLPSLSTYYPQ